MSAGDFDYSGRAFIEALGADAMEQIRQSVAAAPAPDAEVVERLRAIFAPTVARLSRNAAVSAEAA